MDSVSGLITAAALTGDAVIRGLLETRRGQFEYLRRNYKRNNIVLKRTRSYYAGGSKWRVDTTSDGKKYFRDSVPVGKPIPVPARYSPILDPLVIAAMRGTPMPNLPRPMTVLEDMIYNNPGGLASIGASIVLPSSLKGESNPYRAIYLWLLLAIRLCQDPDILKAQVMIYDTFEIYQDMLLDHIRRELDPMDSHTVAAATIVRLLASGSTCPGMVTSDLLSTVASPHIIRNVNSARQGPDGYLCRDLATVESNSLRLETGLCLFVSFFLSSHTQWSQFRIAEAIRQCSWDKSPFTSLVASLIDVHGGSLGIQFMDFHPPGVAPATPAIRRYVNNTTLTRAGTRTCQVDSTHPWFILYTEEAMTSIDGTISWNQAYKGGVMYVYPPQDGKCIIPWYVGCGVVAGRLSPGYCGRAILSAFPIKVKLMASGITVRDAHLTPEATDPPNPHTLHCIDCNMGVNPSYGISNTVLHGPTQWARRTLRVAGRFMMSDLKASMSDGGDVPLHVGHKFSYGTRSGFFKPYSPVEKVGAYIERCVGIDSSSAPPPPRRTSPGCFCHTCASFVDMSIKGASLRHNEHILEFPDLSHSIHYRHTSPSWSINKVRSAMGGKEKAYVTKSHAPFPLRVYLASSSRSTVLKGYQMREDDGVEDWGPISYSGYWSSSRSSVPYEGPSSCVDTLSMLLPRCGPILSIALAYLEPEERLGLKLSSKYYSLSPL